MPQPDFHSLNLGRAFPLRDYASAVPWAPRIANLQITLRPGTEHADAFNTVSLFLGGRTTPVLQNLLGLTSPHCFLAFGSDATGLQGQAMVFAAPTTAATYTEVLSIAASKRDLLLAAGFTTNETAVAVKASLWDGWAVFGDLAEFPIGVVSLTDPIPLEASRVRHVAEPATNTASGRVFVYNEQRTTYTDPTGCEHVTAADPTLTQAYVLSCGPVDIPTRLGGGIQVASSLQSSTGLVTLIGEPGRGDLPKPCEPLALSANEPLRNGLSYDGAPTCLDVLRRINGVQGPDVQLLARSGVNVATFPDLHRVVLSVSGETLVTCPTYDPPTQVEFLPTNDAGVACGDGGGFLPQPGFPVDMTFTSTSTTTSAATATVDPINCLAKCSWVGNGSSWDLVVYPCTSPCSCEQPDTSPVSGNVVTTSCVELPVGDEGNAVRNADFVFDVPLGAWDITGDTTLVDAYPGLAATEFPMILMQGLGAASLSQPKIRVVPKKRYQLFADFWMLGGASVTFQVKTLSGTVLLSRTVNDQEYQRDYNLGQFVTTEDGVNLEVSYPASSLSDRKSLVSRLTILRSQ